MLSLETVFCLSGAYLIFCKFLGPCLMKNREPYSLKIPLALYNTGKLLMNGYIFYMCSSLMGLEVFTFWSNVCDPITAVNTDPNIKDKIYFVWYIYAFGKVIDLLDTVFFILRKKTEQATKEHIIHHATVIVLTVLMDRLNIIEEIFIKMISINSAVHIILNLYYLLSLTNHSSFRKFLYLFKKYIAVILIIELIIILTMLLKNLFYCSKTSPTFLVIWITELISLLWLFSNYFRITYMKKDKKH